jgi:glycosyltransferase involved in cell wall biosynthesis
MALRIAFLINGMTGYLAAQYRALAKLGDDLLVVTPGSPLASGEAMADTAFSGLGAEEFAQVVEWQHAPDPAELVRTVQRFDPDAVFMTSWNYTPAYRAVMKAVDQRVVRVLIMDNVWRAAPKQWLGRAVHRFYVDPVVDAAMVPSDRTEFYARRLGFGPADVIRGSLSGDIELFGSGPRTGAELAGRRSFLYVGRLVVHKGADVLAEAYRAYRDRVEDPWDLEVAGIGPLGDRLQSIPGVTMHGFVQPPQVAELMRAASCLVLTSHIEPYGVVVHEAAAAGLPILCAEFAGAAPGLVQDGNNGWLVPSSDVSGWAAAMARMSAAGPERLQSMSDVSRAIAQRISPAGWALNVHEEIERRAAAGGGRLTTPGTRRLAPVNRKRAIPSTAIDPSQRKR